MRFAEKKPVLPLLIGSLLFPALVLAQSPVITIHAETLFDGKGKILKDQVITINGSRIRCSS